MKRISFLFGGIETLPSINIINIHDFSLSNSIFVQHFSIKLVFYYHFFMISLLQLLLLYYFYSNYYLNYF
jgi:hypothetical protein